MKYRAEIDGLRAIAVVPVILFHAGFELFSGGFVGVDIFFVISGYLITSILIDDIEKNKFSIVKFYERRARRILPALFFVMLVCLPLAWMWMSPGQMKEFSKSLIAVSLFVSNMLFGKEDGYFESAAEEIPLLHTWSLAVEEQYYLTFPIFLFFAWRYGKSNVVWMLAFFTVISLIYCEWGWRHKPIESFFFGPSRAWELYAGSFAAFFIQKYGVQKSNKFSLLGILAIIIAIFAYDENTPFPSLYALLPVMGTVLLVLFMDKKTLVAKILSTKVFVGIGLISYSAYLWHQPLFAFARIRSIEEPSSLLMATLSVTSLLLAIVSWKFVETPFRNSSSFTRERIFIYSVSGILFFSLIGCWGVMKDGFIKPNEIAYEKQLNTKIYVLGDSHADDVVRGLQKVNNKAVEAFTSNGCIPFRNVDRYDSRMKKGECARKVNAYLDALGDVDKPSMVIVSSMGPVYLDGTTFNGKGAERVIGLGVDLITDFNLDDHYQIFENGMRQTLKELSKNNNLTIVYTIDVPELGIDKGCGTSKKELNIIGMQISDLSHQAMLSAEKCHVSRQAYNDRTKAYKALVHTVLKDFPQVILFDPTNVFCNENLCKGYDDQFGYLYRDIDHLSTSGSLYYALNFVEAIAGHHID